eukprot:CAMPEP_0183296400 /NCGR_PEP_ID=MMETSP0160_2-20130417/3972_1 /TAXON_ID=2839 ORGANISM="Odontella Sinensis, Strain Grunow 1884" /NCGR_SAMPLE_ID=MMETSP0160_2 /ASSEMBLY_ACC=CAM_ASM_000250 /LENGTH=117 /DNA_ID=CAMNT_0025458007 /DNA_START=493 /DNA_END=846 /DNA_ORIENTATION=-
MVPGGTWTFMIFCSELGCCCVSPGAVMPLYQLSPLARDGESCMLAGPTGTAKGIGSDASTGGEVGPVVAWAIGGIDGPACGTTGGNCTMNVAPGLMPPGIAAWTIRPLPSGAITCST